MSSAQSVVGAPAMRLSEFDFDLPEHLIAQHPPEDRSGGRLLVLDGAARKPAHQQITDLPGLLRRGDLLVLNNTRVYPARLHGNKSSGGKVELLVERVIDERRASCLCRSSKSPREGAVIHLSSGHEAVILGRNADLFEIEFSVGLPLLDYLEQHGNLPLPPYIQREVKDTDKERYQTVYARETGAIAAPTAGLHFDEALLDGCKHAGIDTAFITLHVGAGTFQPVRVDEVEQHQMHAETLKVTSSLCDKISATKGNGGRVIAVGTTAVRALETAASSGRLNPFEGDTRLFIKPGDHFNVVDGLITNFHLPRSTLLMLVCAFAGRDRLLDAYAEAVRHQYRFFSYGDAMLLFPQTNSSAADL